MHFVRRAAWLCTCLAALAPQVATAGTARTRLTIGVTVVTPCRIGTQADSIVWCMGRVARVTKANGPSPSAGTSTIPNTPASYAKFVEVAF